MTESEKRALETYADNEDVLCIFSDGMYTLRSIDWFARQLDIRDAIGESDAYLIDPEGPTLVPIVVEEPIIHNPGRFRYGYSNLTVGGTVIGQVTWTDH